YQLTSEEINEITSALHHAKSQGHTCATLTKADFPIEGLRETLDRTLEALEHEYGAYVLRGFPALEHSKEDLRLIYWGLGLHLGVPVSQSSKGDLLGDVRDFQADAFSPTGRGYMSRQHLSFHTDTADVVALMVLRTAKSGGLSRMC